MLGAKLYMKINMTKEQEQLARETYEAFCRALPHHCTPVWRVISDTTKEAWYAAAEAAVTHWLQAELNAGRCKQIP